MVFSDSSLVVKLPDIKKEVENDEFELESADREEEIDEEEEDSEEEEGEEDQDEDEEELAIANTEKRQSTEGEDSTDTEMRKNVAGRFYFLSKTLLVRFDSPKSDHTRTVHAFIFFA